MTQLTELDYESIETAVMQTARGRWFLSEYKKRNEGTNTPALLDAIGRLEKVITSIGTDFPANIAKKATPEQRPPELEIKPAIIPPAAEIPAPPSPAILAPAPLSTDNLQFFANDEDLFSDEINTLPSQEPKSASPLESKSADAQKTDKTETSDPAFTNELTSKSKNADQKENAETKPKRERFKVFKTTPDVDAKESKPAKSTEQNQPKESKSEVPDPVMKATSEEQDRIVIIRKSSDADIEIPLADEFNEAVAKH